MRVEHEVGARTRRRAARAPRAPASTSPLGPRLGGAGGGVGVGERDPRHAVRARLRDQRLVRALGGQADELEARPRAATTSSACVPIEPVEPRMSSRFIRRP